MTLTTALVLLAMAVVAVVAIVPTLLECAARRPEPRSRPSASLISPAPAATPAPTRARLV
jgi:hypothetical protein